MLKTASEMKEIDSKAINELGISSTLLMENAANGLTGLIEVCCRNLAEPYVLIVIGSGNNGGDGIAAARILYKKGIKTDVVLVGSREKMTADSLEMERRLLACGSSTVMDASELESALKECNVIVDCIFGVGLNREVSGKYRKVIELMNRKDAVKIACDIPSGINADTGEVMGCAFRADATATFTCGKPGLYQKEGAKAAGNVVIVPIGIPEELL